MIATRGKFDWQPVHCLDCGRKLFEMSPTSGQWSGAVLIKCACGAVNTIQSANQESKP